MPEEIKTRPATLIKLIPFIVEGKQDLIEISSRSGISFEVLKEALIFLEGENIAKIDGNTVQFEKGAKVLASVSALKLGSSIDEVSKALSWKDFEEFISIIMAHNGYRVHHNFRLKHPKIEIDVLAVKDERGLAIDCKHWHRSMGVSSILKVAEAQIKRAEKIMMSEEAKRFSLSYIIPVIVTLYSEQVFFVSKVPVVPIDKFSHFLNELDGMLDMILIVK
ncbi:MAG: restriction endonuclease [archaeon]|nr:restriction endonuclease [archaeon]